MTKKILITILFFYALILIQTSFFVHFSIAGIVPNLVFITVIILNIFEDPQKKLGIISALSGGFFLDIFSARPVGFYIFILIFLAVILKYILRKHIQLPIIKNI